MSREREAAAIEIAARCAMDGTMMQLSDWRDWLCVCATFSLSALRSGAPLPHLLLPHFVCALPCPLA